MRSRSVTFQFHRCFHFSLKLAAEVRKPNYIRHKRTKWRRLTTWWQGLSLDLPVLAFQTVLFLRIIQPQLGLFRFHCIVILVIVRCSFPSHYRSLPSGSHEIDRSEDNNADFCVNFCRSLHPYYFGYNPVRFQNEKVFALGYYLDERLLSNLWPLKDMILDIISTLFLNAYYVIGWN